VAARSLTLAQAIVVASTMEFLGAILIGASVTNTIRSKIIDQAFYDDVPELLMFGMLSALIVASCWLLLATYLEFPVSTTHDIIGCIIGFSLAAMGWDVSWKKKRKTITSPLQKDSNPLTLVLAVQTLVQLHSLSIGRRSKN
jgi:phosphate/sulfate permease